MADISLIMLMVISVGRREATLYNITEKCYRGVRPWYIAFGRDVGS